MSKAVSRLYHFAIKTADPYVPAKLKPMWDSPAGIIHVAVSFMLLVAHVYLHFLKYELIYVNSLILELGFVTLVIRFILMYHG